MIHGKKMEIFKMKRAEQVDIRLARNEMKTDILIKMFNKKKVMRYSDRVCLKTQVEIEKISGYMI